MRLRKYGICSRGAGPAMNVRKMPTTLLRGRSFMRRMFCTGWKLVANRQTGKEMHASPFFDRNIEGKGEEKQTHQKQT